MKKLFCILFICLLFTACQREQSARPNLFEVVTKPVIQSYRYITGQPRFVYFVYALPAGETWQSIKSTRVLEGFLKISESIKMRSLKKGQQYSERFRELFLRKQIQPIDFLGYLKKADRKICKNISFNIVKKEGGALIYREIARNCKAGPRKFTLYGKVLLTASGLVNLQYQAASAHVKWSRIQAMYGVIQRAKVRGYEIP